MQKYTNSKFRNMYS